MSQPPNQPPSYSSIAFSFILAVFTLFSIYHENAPFFLPIGLAVLTCLLIAGNLFRWTPGIESLLFGLTAVILLVASFVSNNFVTGLATFFVLTDGLLLVTSNWGFKK